MRREQFDALLVRLQVRARDQGHAAYGEDVRAKLDGAGKVRLFYRGKMASQNYLRAKLANGS